MGKKTEPDLEREGAEQVYDRLELIAQENKLEAATLVAGVRDWVLDLLRAQPKTWGQMLEGQQRDVAASIETNAKEIVTQIAEAIAAAGHQPVRALVTKVTLGDDIVVTLKAKPFTEEETDQAVMALHKAHGKHVMITVASSQDYDGGEGPQIDADQPAMEFEAGNDHPDDDSDLADLEPIEVEVTPEEATAFRDAVKFEQEGDQKPLSDWFETVAKAYSLDPDSIDAPDEAPAEGVFKITGEPAKPEPEPEAAD